MAATKPRGSGKFQKAKILSSLKDTQAAILAQLEDYDTKLARWKTEAPEKFAHAVAEYGTSSNHWSTFEFEPPRRSSACSDWRIQALNKHIARVDSMSDIEGIVTILNSDSLWEYVGQAACI